jgi:hypothetical protein
MPTDQNVLKQDKVVLKIDVTAEIDFTDNMHMQMRLLTFNQNLHLLMRQELGDSLRLTENQTEFGE